MKLNNEKANAAWADYKAFLEALSVRGVPLERSNFRLMDLKQAFLMGHAQGLHQGVKEMYEKQKKQAQVGHPFDGIVIDNLKMPDFVKKYLNQQAAARETKPEQMAFEIKEGRKVRTKERIKSDNRLIASIIRNLGVVKLEDIFKHAKNTGATHTEDWNKQSYTSYVEAAMQQYPQIKRVRRGYYEWQE